MAQCNKCTERKREAEYLQHTADTVWGRFRVERSCHWEFMCSVASLQREIDLCHCVPEDSARFLGACI